MSVTFNICVVVNVSYAIPSNAQFNYNMLTILHISTLIALWLATSSRILSDTHRDRGSYFHLRQADFMQHARRRWAYYNHTAHSTSLGVRVLSSRCIVAHPWPVRKDDWGRKILTRIGGSRGSAIGQKSRVRARLLVLFLCHPILSELWVSQLSEQLATSSQILSEKSIHHYIYSQRHLHKHGKTEAAREHDKGTDNENG